MSLFFTLFFVSLAGMCILLGRRILLLKKIPNSGTIDTDDALVDVHHMKAIKNMTIRSAKELEHIALVSALKVYVLSLNFLKKRYEEMRKISKKYMPASEKKLVEKKANGFLLLISDYQRRIRKIKHKIKKDQGIE